VSVVTVVQTVFLVKAFGVINVNKETPRPAECLQSSGFFLELLVSFPRIPQNKIYIPDTTAMGFNTVILC
jgi:hypothetical protein